MRLTLLGGFSLSLASEAFHLPRSAQRVLAYLALQPRAVLRQRAAFALWPEASERHAHGSLRAATFRLRCLCPESIVGEGPQIGLGPDVVVDVRRALDLAGQTEGVDGAVLDELEDILHTGELLPDLYEDWVLVERERFHEFRSNTLEALSERHLRDGRAGRAREAALVAVHADPLRESSRRALIRAHLDAGNHADAIAHYEQFVELMDRSRLTPSPQLFQLVRGLIGC